MNNSTVSTQRFQEHVSQNQNDVQLVKSGELTAKQLAEKYFDVDETEGLSVEDATKAIEALTK